MVCTPCQQKRQARQTSNRQRNYQKYLYVGPDIDNLPSLKPATTYGQRVSDTEMFVDVNDFNNQQQIIEQLGLDTNLYPAIWEVIV